jgi:hypothetical protein
LGDCLLWHFFKIADVAHIFVFPTLSFCINFDKNGVWLHFRPLFRKPIWSHFSLPTYISRRYRISSSSIGEHRRPALDLCYIFSTLSRYTYVLCFFLEWTDCLFSDIISKWDNSIFNVDKYVLAKQGTEMTMLRYKSASSDPVHLRPLLYSKAKDGEKSSAYALERPLIP